MTKQEEIEEMNKPIKQGFEKADCRKPYSNEPYPYFDSQIYNIAENIYNAGYRKSDEVLKETAAEILPAVDNESNGQTISITNYLRKEYGVEVEE